MARGRRGASAHAERPPDADEIERVGLRLQLRKARPKPATSFSSTATRARPDAPYLARAWACAVRTCGCGAGQAKKVAIIGSLDQVTRQLIVHTSRPSAAATHRSPRALTPVRSQPGRAMKPVVLVRRRADPCQQAHSQGLEARKHGSPSSGCESDSIGEGHGAAFAFRLASGTSASPSLSYRRCALSRLVRTMIAARCLALGRPCPRPQDL